MACFFSIHDFSNHIIGITPDCFEELPPSSDEYLRSQEIDKWLKDNADNGTPHLIIDDIDLSKWHRNAFVHCWLYDGFTEHTVGAALDLLENQLNEKNNNANNSQTLLLDRYQIWLS